jgi:hypothetical protein
VQFGFHSGWKVNDCRPSSSDGKLLSIKFDRKVVCLQEHRSVPAAHVCVGCTSEITAFRPGLDFESRTSPRTQQGLA